MYRRESGKSREKLKKIAGNSSSKKYRNSGDAGMGDSRQTKQAAQCPRAPLATAPHLEKAF